MSRWQLIIGGRRMAPGKMSNKTLKPTRFRYAPAVGLALR
jgi:hypothetical protein